ncbi:hypothetical protein HPB47_028110 [Ixodes persulcatus]|uniref:Uncharacterized protein n=1 Tax=Ixodes persulcatus TaxID=34615 RepID=A0AC60PU57_IXOPE|nr:hypothetical protein HPB47_028110 [Ixodes persulcatus]
MGSELDHRKYRGRGLYAMKLSMITQIQLGAALYELMPCLIPLPGTVRGVVHGIEAGTTGEELKELISVNGYNILHARMLGKSRTALLTFEEPHVPFYTGKRVACSPDAGPTADPRSTAGPAGISATDRTSAPTRTQTGATDAERKILKTITCVSLSASCATNPPKRQARNVRNDSNQVPHRYT